MKTGRERIISVYFWILTVFLVSSLVFKIIDTIPQDLLLIEGKEYIFKFNAPLNVGITVDQKDMLKLNGTSIGADKHNVKLRNPLKIESNRTGKANLKIMLFGKIPFKTVKVNVIQQTYVVPCGNTVGVKLYTKGVLVVGTSSLTGIDGKQHNPAAGADIEEGDSILSVNNKTIESVKDFSDSILKSNGETIRLNIQKQDTLKDIFISPIKCHEDGKYRLGLWVRDSTTGIGTLTFYDPNTQSFGALGHGITDIDTDTLLSVKNGDILESSIISVKRGKKGEPGELKGVFLNEDFKIGSILDNNYQGIYGKVKNANTLINNAIVPVGLKNEIKEGPAVILSNIDGRKVEAFAIDIQKIMRQNRDSSKNMVIKVTDSNLIEKTGGIVQGMSGSPIIQDGKLIGAVTHVFVNDPTRGYGIFAELMVQNTSKIKK